MATDYEALRAGETAQPNTFSRQIARLRRTFFTYTGDGLPYDRFLPPFPKHEGQRCWGCEQMLPWHCSVRQPGPDGRPRLIDAHQCLGPNIADYPALPPWRQGHAR